jgi:hypothetical protein
MGDAIARKRSSNEKTDAAYFDSTTAKLAA